MRSRTLREGSVGLLILVGMGLFTGLVLWLRGLNPGSRTYSLEVELADAAGIEVGSTVRYRGVKIGTVTSMQTGTNSAKVVATISPGNLLIPRQSVVETTQSGFIGQVFLDFRPPAVMPVVNTQNQSPFGPNCNAELFFCDGDKLKGNVGANFDQLIRATTTIADSLQQSQLIELASRTLKTADSTLQRFDQTAVGLAATAKDIRLLTQDARGQFKNLGAASTSVTTAANEVTSLVRANRGTISTSLQNLDQAGQELKAAVTSLRPFLNRWQESKLLVNLESLAENGSAAAANLKGLSGNLNNPITLIGLVQTLDAARATFVNTQKITADLQKVTSDANFSKNLLNLIRGLSKLVSSSQELERQILALQAEAPAAPTTNPLATAPTLNLTPLVTSTNPVPAPPPQQLIPQQLSADPFAPLTSTSNPLPTWTSPVTVEPQSNQPPSNQPLLLDSVPTLATTPVPTTQP